MVEVVDSNACSNRDTVTVIIYPNPTIELGNDTTIPFGTTIILAPGFGYQSYAWSNGSSADYIEVGLPGTFTVSVTDYNGCVSRDTVIISMPSYIDLALIHFAQLVEQSCYGANENLIVTVKNTGNRVHDFTINPINIESTVTGPTPQNYSLQINSDSLMPDSSRNYLISSLLKLSRPGAYNISSQIVPLIPDSNTTNDFISLQINSTNPEITISTVSSTICVGDSVNVNASASVSGLTQPASFESNIQVNIPDNDPIGTTSSISISGVSFNANEIVSITIDSIIHPSVGDLILTLIAPNGSQTFLSINNGNGANYIATRFTSSATSSITTSNAPFTGDFLPQSPFTSLTGNASGNWTLLVKDVSDQNTTTGILYGWELEFPQQNYVTSNVWTPASSVNGASTLTPALYPATTTQYTLTVTDANGCSSIDSLLVDVGTCDAINELNEKESGLSIFPNPTSDLVNVLINDSNFSLVLMDALGKELLKSSNLNHKTVINLQNVEPGIYFIYLINSNKQIIIKKIIKN
jgi:subtilisin-like proprotein convertase family protein